MQPGGFKRSGLQLQVVFTVGVVVVALMGLISMTVVLQARSQILSQHRNGAAAVAHAFSIPAMDALILGEQTGSAASDVLDNHIRTFLGAMDGILSISIVDPGGWIIAHSDPRLYSEPITDDTLLRASRALEPMTSVFQDDMGRWITEAAVPLQVGSKRWGAALLRFDAEPTRQQVTRLFLLLFLLTLALTTATIGILYLLVGRITASLRALVAEVDKIDFETDTPITMEAPSNEIGYLIHHFGLLKDRLVQSRSELVAAQYQVHQAEKMASVGRLASGVAHEVNNPLNGIWFCLHGIQSDPENREQTERYLGLIGDGIQQIELVVQKLLGFARSQPASFEEISLNEQVRAVLDFIDFQFKGREATVQVSLDADLPAVRADAGLLKEVIMNLLLNSLDAIEQSGKIRIQSGRTDEEGVFLSITDNGVGIPEEHLSQIFEPFFTTKETGKGTGLGLSVTLGIVELHGGSIRVHSDPGRKTTFTVALPARGTP